MLLLGELKQPEGSLSRTGAVQRSWSGLGSVPSLRDPGAAEPTVRSRAALVGAEGSREGKAPPWAPAEHPGALQRDRGQPWDRARATPGSSLSHSVTPCCQNCNSTKTWLQNPCSCCIFMNLFSVLLKHIYHPSHPI